MNKLKILLALFSLVLIGLVGCDDETYVGLPSQDNIAPGVPRLVEVVNKNGGAVIYFEAPADQDLLSVTAEYTINGLKRSTSASSYVDSLYVDGFGASGEYKVNLKSIDKSKNVSSSIEVTVNPLEPPVSLIQKTINTTDAFGGIRLTWKNETEADVIIIVNIKDSLEEWIPLEMFYTKAVDGSQTIRGLKIATQDFQIYVRDRWDNYSELIEVKQTPIFEKELDKTKFKELKLPGDMTPADGFPISMIWDNIVNSWRNGVHRAPGPLGIITFDLGQVAKLSRYKMWQRFSEYSYLYTHANLKEYKVWGVKDLTSDMRVSGSFDGWTLLLDAECYRPSGNKENEPSTNEDLAYAKAGDDQEIPLDKEPVRYIRIQMVSNWSFGTHFTIGEMSFWGQIIE